MKRVYGASRVKHAAMWKALRDAGEPIISSWIDEAGEGETKSLSELWERIEREVKSATLLVLYVEENDFPLKGALIEAGMAIAFGVPVFVVLGGDFELETRTLRPLGSWAQHPLVEFKDSVVEALR